MDGSGSVRLRGKEVMVRRDERDLHQTQSDSTGGRLVPTGLVGETYETIMDNF